MEVSCGYPQRRKVADDFNRLRAGEQWGDQPPPFSQTKAVKVMMSLGTPFFLQ